MAKPATKCTTPVDGGATGRPWLWATLVLGLTLLGFGLRVYGAGTQSIWADELYSVGYTQLSPLGIIRVNIANSDPQTPLYYLLLKFWLLAAGQSELAVRFLSVLAGTATIPAVARLGALLGQRKAGLCAAAFLAVSAYQVWYAQEARTYTLTTALSLASLLCFARLLQPPRRRWLYVGLVASTTLAVYSHYYALLILLTENLLFVLLARPLRLPIRPWLVVQLALTVPYLPWAGQAARLLLQHKGEGQLVSTSMVVDVFRQHSLAWFLPPPLTDWLLVGFGALSLVGLLALLWPPRGRSLAGTLVPILYLLGPLLAAIAFVAIVRRPLFGARYLILITPGYALLLGAAVVGLGRLRWPAGALALAFLVGSNAYALSQYYDNPHFAKPDHRSLTAYLTASQQPADAIVAIGDEVVMALELYYRGGLPVANLTFRIPREQTPEELARVSQRYQRLWLIPYGDGDLDRAAADWLNRNAYLLTARWFGQTQLRLYATSRQDLQPLSTTALRFEQGVSLLAVRAGPLPATAGDTVETDLELQVPAALQPGHSVVVRLVDQDGHLLAHAEHFISEGQQEQDGTVRLRRALRLPADSLPGPYTLLAGLYRVADGKRLALVDKYDIPQGIWATVGQVPVTRRPQEARAVASTSAQRVVGGLLQLQEAALASASVSPGDTLVVALSWLALRAPGADLAIGVELLDDAGRVIANRLGSAANRAYPTSLWAPGEAVRDYLDLPIDGRTPGGSYEARLFVQDGAERLPTPSGKTITLGKVRVQGRPHLFTPPAIRYALPRQFGDAVELLGYDLSGLPARVGGNLRVVLYWRARGETVQNYTAFAHLLDRSNRVVAQHDGPPAGGAALTSSWVAGEFVEDVHEVVLPRDLSAGEYRLEIGLYDSVTGNRLLLSGATAGADHVLLPDPLPVEAPR